MSGTNSQKVTKLEERPGEKSSLRRMMNYSKNFGRFVIKLGLKVKMKKRVFLWQISKLHFCTVETLLKKVLPD